MIGAPLRRRRRSRQAMRLRRTTPTVCRIAARSGDAFPIETLEQTWRALDGLNREHFRQRRLAVVGRLLSEGGSA